MKIQCLECKNDKEIDNKDIEPGKWFECAYCGVSFEIVKINADGQPQIHIIEEEK